MHYRLSVLPLQLIIAIVCSLFSVSNALALFDELTLPPSPRTNGMGGALTIGAMNDPLSPIINPGTMGILAGHNVFAGAVYAPRTRWFPVWYEYEKPYYWTRAAMVGLNADCLSKIVKRRIPASIGIGYNEVEFGFPLYGPREQTEHNYSHGVSFGLGIDGRIKAGIGLTLKRSRDTYPEEDVSGNAADYGFVLYAPFPAVFRSRQTLEKGVSYFITPQFSYAATNVGKAVEYVYWDDHRELMPLPRMGKVTVGAGAGFVLNDSVGPPWQLFSVEIAVQGEDGLITYEEDSHKYRQPFGDIHVFGDLILGQGNGRIQKNRGYEVNVMEALYVRRGSTEYAGNSYVISTEGWGLRAAGIFRLLQKLVPEVAAEKTADFVMRHIDLQLDESTWVAESPVNGTRFRSVSLYFKP